MPKIDRQNVEGVIYRRFLRHSVQYQMRNLQNMKCIANPFRISRGKLHLTFSLDLELFY